MPLKKKLFVLLALVLVFVAWACVDMQQAVSEEKPDAKKSASSKEGKNVNAQEHKFDFVLSSGNAEAMQNGGAAAKEQAASEVKPLDKARRDQLLGRLPALPAADSLVKDFNRRADSIPAPRSGETVKVSFPPPDEIAQGVNAPDAKLAADAPVATLERYSPEGKIHTAQAITLTFSQPMIALQSLDMSDAFIPAEVSPKTEGSWRWMGTRTVVFEPKIHHLPMSTDYEVTVPATLKDAAGRPIDKEHKFSFSTERLKIQGTYPYGGTVGPEPVCYMTFNQPVEPQKIIKFIQLRENNSSKEAVAIKLVEKDKIPDDVPAYGAAKNAEKDRFVAFRPTAPLKADTSYQIVLLKGAPAAEGPLTTESDETRSFRTYSPLEVSWTNADRSWNNGKLGVGEPFLINFNNQLDKKACPALDAVEAVEPKLAGMNISISGCQLKISGEMKANTDYSVKLNPKITDIYGQTFGSKASRLITFRVGPLEPYIEAPGRDIAVLDPQGPPVYSIYTGAVDKFRIKLFKANFQEFTEYRSEYHSFETLDKFKGIGKEVWDKTIKVNGRPSELIQNRIDLSKGLNDEGHGLLLLAIEYGKPRSEHHYTKTIWLQATHLGLDVVEDDQNAYCYVTDLCTGKPIEGATVYGVHEKATTDANGRAVLPGEESKREGRSSGYHFRTTHGSDMAFASGTSNFRFNDKKNLLWHVFDDRGLYRPQEVVHVKGWIRSIDRGPQANAQLESGLGPVSWTLKDPRGAKLSTGTAQLSDCGGFDFEVTLPDNINLGTARIDLSADGASLGKYNSNNQSHTFKVEEFRRPEFEVSTSVDSADHFMKGQALVTAKASYFAGGVLSNSDVTWRASATESSYSPPGWHKFTFGEWRPWWGCYWMRHESSNDSVSHDLKLQTDSMGQSDLKFDLGYNLPPQPVTISVSAAVTDVNRQTWSSRSSFLVHPANVYVGLKMDKNHCDVGSKPKLDLIVADLDGKAVAGKKISLHWARLDTIVDDGDNYVEKEMETFDDSVTSAAAPVSKDLHFNKAGVWRLIAKVTDDKGRVNQSTLRIWVGSFERAASSVKTVVEREELTLIPDKEEYQPGDTAEILVQSPFHATSGVYTINRDGIAKSEHFSIDGTNASLKIPIDKNWIPGLNLFVSVNGTSERVDSDGHKIKGAPSRPAFATSSLTLSVSTREKALTVKALPKSAKLAPGDATEVDVVVTDANGKPVPDAEVALVVVDDSVWALTGYSISDPLSKFYNRKGGAISNRYLRSIVLLNAQTVKVQQEARQQEMDMMAVEESCPAAAGGAMPGFGAAPGRALMKSVRMDSVARSAAVNSYAEAEVADVGGMPGEDSDKPIALRQNFNPLAIFMAALKTDAQGKGKVKVNMPDNLTRYRVVAVAATKDSCFGLGENSITARLPLMVRPSAPRFLNFGDKFSLPVVLHNQTSQNLRVEVAARASNLTVPAPGGYVCTVPAESRREVLIPMEVEQVGEANIQVAAASGVLADSAECKLPVYTPCTTEGFATYGTMDKEGVIFQPMNRPDNAFSQFGELEISTSSTALQELTDAVIYLCDYPFACSEQLASRIIVIANLHEVLSEFNVPELPSKKEITNYINRDLKELKKRQDRSSGGFGLWKAGDEIFPFASVHCAQALVVARSKGFNVDDYTYERALKYAQNAYNHAKRSRYQYSAETLLNLTAYADNVLWQAGKQSNGDSKKFEVSEHYKDLRKFDLNHLSIDTLGWYLPVVKDAVGDATLAADISRVINNRITETAGKANVGSFGENDGYLILYSSFRSEAVALTAMMFDKPDSSVIPKLVRAILDGRQHGHWGTTNSNAMVVMALNQYFRTYEKVTPDFVARWWLGSQYVGDHKFKGRETKYLDTTIPMAQVPAKANIALDKQGQGRLYYRLGLKYALKNLTPPAREAGFAVSRIYEGVDDPNDVKQIDANTWQFKLGSRIRCRTSLVAPARRAHVALVVPLPAGCEILNGRLKMTEDIPSDKRVSNNNDTPWFWWWWRDPFDHENLRDERAEAFSFILPGGKYDYSFVMRATAPGTFVVPPAKAEEMYSPETFGRCSGVKVVIK